MKTNINEMLRFEYVVRCRNPPEFNSQTIARHQWWVAMIAYNIVPSAVNRTSLHSLIYDCGELESSLYYIPN